MTSQHLLSLADRVEGLAGPDTGMDAEIAAAVGISEPLDYTGSLDAAATLVKPPLYFGLLGNGAKVGRCIGKGVSPALALVAASLRAIAGGASA